MSMSLTDFYNYLEEFYHIFPINNATQYLFWWFIPKPQNI